MDEWDAWDADEHGLPVGRGRDAEMTLDEEIAALRQMLRRVLVEAAAADADADDVIRAAGTIARLSEALVKAVRADRALRPSQDDAMREAWVTVLTEMGLGGE